MRSADVAEIRKVHAMIWNGPMGAFEHKPFAAGSLVIARAMAQSDAVTVVVGGDSGAALACSGSPTGVTHLSTGRRKLIDGAELPGFEVVAPVA